jgi:RHS repeat-associated protein
LSSLTYPYAPLGDKAVVNESYDATGALSALTDFAGGRIGFSHDQDANTTSVSYPGGATAAYSYDLAGSMTSAVATSPAGTVLAGQGYNLDHAEQVVSETGTGVLSTSRSYGYDAADRLASVTNAAAGPANESYDPSGDPTQLANGTTQAFDLAGELTSATTSSAKTATSAETTTFSYDPTGDRIAQAPLTGTASTINWDQTGRLVSFVPMDAPLTGTAATVTYGYDATGLLSSRSVAAGTSYMTWDATSGLALLLSDGTNDYLYGPAGTPVEQASLATGSTEYFLSGHQGSTLALVGQTGSLDATFSYDAYGNLTTSTGTASTPLLYDGQYLDPASGFYYLRARWYDPATATFISVDPLVSQTGQAYGYAAGNPLQYSDDTGRSASSPQPMQETKNLPKGPWHEPAIDVPIVKSPYTFMAPLPELDTGTACASKPVTLYWYISDTEGAGGAGSGNTFTITNNSTGFSWVWVEGDASFELPVAEREVEPGKDPEDGAVVLYYTNYSYHSPVGYMRPGPNTLGDTITARDDLGPGEDTVVGYHMIINWPLSEVRQ